MVPVKRSRQLAHFPYLEVGGTHYAIGVEIGKQFGWEIQQRLARWSALNRLREFASGEGSGLYGQLHARADGFCPEGIEELRGMADGAGCEFRDLFLLTCRGEFDERLDTPACTTLVARGVDGRILVGHNEDGGPPQVGLLYVLRVEPNDAPAFVSLTYAGQIPGNGPSGNECGIFSVTNNIRAHAPPPGIPRYFVTRRLRSSQSLAEAIDIATTPGRAFGFHTTIASRQERRAVGVEVTPDRDHVTEIEHLYVHTNHYVSDSLRDDEQIAARSNTVIRFETAARRLDGLGPDFSLSDLLDILRSHDELPHTICAHPGRELQRATLGSVLIDTSGRVMRIYSGNPCGGPFRDYVV